MPAAARDGTSGGPTSSPLATAQKSYFSCSPCCCFELLLLFSMLLWLLSLSFKSLKQLLLIMPCRAWTIITSESSYFACCCHWKVIFSFRVFITASIVIYSKYTQFDYKQECQVYLGLHQSICTKMSCWAVMSHRRASQIYSHKSLLGWGRGNQWNWQLLKRELNVKCEREVEGEVMRKKRMVTRQGVNV